jgi:hypothetical protein
MTAIHTPECAAYIQKIEAAISAFDTKYPNHCTDCGGSGMLAWSDPDVGIFQAFDPCTFCECKLEGAHCALCGQPGDFTERTLTMDENDVRPCGCPVTEYRPDHEGCSCYAGVVDLPDTQPADQAGVEITDEVDDYNYAADDFAFDAARERAAFGPFRGRD